MLHSTYRGINIWRNVHPSAKLKWYCVRPNLAADTLAGIKDLIRRYVDA